MADDISESSVTSSLRSFTVFVVPFLALMVSLSAEVATMGALL